MEVLVYTCVGVCLFFVLIHFFLCGWIATQPSSTLPYPPQNRIRCKVRYESVIHEFDPYFNFRTTKFLATEGFLDFLNWFDDRGW